MTSAPNSEPAVALRHITKRYPGVLANDDISLEIRAGEVHVLLGENGAGKSTLIALLAGMRQPDSGEIVVRGRAVRLASPRAALSHGIGTMFQHPLLVPGLTIIENLLLGRPWWRRVDRAVARARYRAISDLLPGRPDPDTPAGALGAGQQRFVELLRALWWGGAVLVLDEPTSMLAPDDADALLGTLRRLREAGMAIVFVTHRLAEACAIGDRVTVLRQGRVAGRIEPATMRSLPADAWTAEATTLMFGIAEPARIDRHAPSVPGQAAPRLRMRDAATASESGACSLRSVSLDVGAGEILGIAGIEGSGQRHLAEAIAGQRRLSHGRMEVDGRDVTDDGVAERRRAGVAYLAEDRLGEATVPGLSVALNLVLDRIGAPPFWRHGLTRRDRIAAFARGRIARDDIRAVSEQSAVATLSGGNVQRLVLSRDLDAATAVAVFHQPTQGLDARSARDARQRIAACAARGAAVILISSDIEELASLTDRIGVLAGGRLVGMVAAGTGTGTERRIGELIAGVAA